GRRAAARARPPSRSAPGRSPRARARPDLRVARRNLRAARAAYRSSFPDSCGIAAHERLQGREAIGEGDGLTRVLLKKLLHRRPEADRLVDARIAALLVRTDRNQVAVLLIHGVDLAEAANELSMLKSGDGEREPADRGLDVDRGIVAPLRERAR